MGGVRFEAPHGGGSRNNNRSNNFVDRSASDVARLSVAHLGTALRRQGEDAAQKVRVDAEVAGVILRAETNAFWLTGLLPLLL